MTCSMVVDYMMTVRCRRFGSDCRRVMAVLISPVFFSDCCPVVCRMTLSDSSPSSGLLNLCAVMIK